MIMYKTVGCYMTDNAYVCVCVGYAFSGRTSSKRDGHTSLQIVLEFVNIRPGRCLRLILSDC